MSQGKLSPIWRSRCVTLTVLCRGNGAPRREDALEMSMSCCMCEPMETAQSLGDDTHAVVARPSGHESTDDTQSVVPHVGLAHRRVLGTRTWVEVNVRPHPLCKKRQVSSNYLNVPTTHPITKSNTN